MTAILCLRDRGDSIAADPETIHFIFKIVGGPPCE